MKLIKFTLSGVFGYDLPDKKIVGKLIVERGIFNKRYEQHFITKVGSGKWKINNTNKTISDWHMLGVIHDWEQNHGKMLDFVQDGEVL